MIRLRDESPKRCMLREPKENAFLLVRAGSVICALPLRRVRETLRPLPTEPLSGMPPFVRGVSIIRGIPTPVVDLAVLVLGCEAHAPARYVTLRLAERQAALSVDGVLGIKMLLESAFGSLPPLLREPHEHLIETIAALDRELLLVLNAGRLVPEEAWRAIET